MKPAARSDGWTYEDYLGFPDDGKRYEILEGEKVVTPAPVPRHQIVLARIYDALKAFAEEQDLGSVLFAPIDVLLAENTVVQPDLLFIAKDRASIIGDRAITEAPDLVIEIHSPATHKLDHVTKRRIYAVHGVREYWIVDPDLEKVEVFVLERGTLEKRAEVTEGAVGSFAVLPGLRIPCPKIFA